MMANSFLTPLPAFRVECDEVITEGNCRHLLSAPSACNETGSSSFPWQGVCDCTSSCPPSSIARSLGCLSFLKETSHLPGVCQRSLVVASHFVEASFPWGSPWVCRGSSSEGYGGMLKRIALNYWIFPDFKLLTWNWHLQTFECGNYSEFTKILSTDLSLWQQLRTVHFGCLCAQRFPQLPCCSPACVSDYFGSCWVNIL